MELYGIDATARVLQRRDGGFRVTGSMEAFRKLCNAVAMAIPDAQRRGNVCKQLGVLCAFGRQVQAGAAVFLTLHLLNDPTESACDPLHPVTDSQNGDVQFQDFRAAYRRAGVVHGTRAARQNDAHWRKRPNFVNRGSTGENRGEDPLLANAPRDQLRVLAAEVENHDSAEFGSWSWSVLLHCCSCCHSLSPLRRKDALRV